MSHDLVAFLSARLNEEHYLAHKFVYVDGGEWTADELARLWWYSDPPKPRSATDPIIQHAAHYNPARVLREVQAKRAILELHQPDRDPKDEWYGNDVRCQECGGVTGNIHTGPRGFNRSWPCRTLRNLAAIYSDHPGYQEEWNEIKMSRRSDA